jgi:2-polyprenyl-3-methyl-5-hydroxy-6-metoxy-1,4-benzoquinol methylase
MTQEQQIEGLEYAKNAFKGAASHLSLDKKLIAENFDFNGKKILDFGCGMGGMTLWYAENWNCEVVGVDIDPNHIEIAQKLRTEYGVENVRFELRNVLENPIQEKFDYIILNDVAEHIRLDILEKIIAQLKECLNPTGGIFVSYPPWEGPYASHLNHDIALPWCQFLPDFMLRKMMEKHNRVLVGTKTLMQEYDELNHLNHQKLSRISKKTGLKIAFRKSHSKLNKISAFANINFNKAFFKYLVTKELVVLSA